MVSFLSVCVCVFGLSRVGAGRGRRRCRRVFVDFVQGTRT